MKIALIITVVFSAIITALLVDCRNHGLHPDMKSFGLMIPVLFVYIWAKATMFQSVKSSK